MRRKQRAMWVFAAELTCILTAQAAEFDCVIEPHVVVNVSTAVEEVLKTVHVEKGDRVTAGQVLATLESDVEKASIELARARMNMVADLESRNVRLRHSQRKLTRADELAKKQYISPDERDEAETNKLVAELDLRQEQENKELARLDLQRAVATYEMRTIRSPITGVVVERFLSSGEFAQAKPIVKLAQLDPLKVEAVLPVTTYNAIKTGMRAEVIPEEPMNQVYPAVVKIVDQVIDAASGTFQVRLELPNPNYRLPAGLRCKVRFLGLQPQAAPGSALQ